MLVPSEDERVDVFVLNTLEPEIGRETQGETLFLLSPQRVSHLSGKGRTVSIGHPFDT